MKNPRSGYTLVESVIGMTILVTLLGSAVVVLDSSQRSFNETISSGIVNRSAARALDRISRALTGARLSALVISPEADSVGFQKVAGWAGGSVVWSKNSELRLEYERNELDNGIDDDGDGLVDECQIVMTENVGQPDERSVVLVKSVREFLEGEEPDGADNNGNLIEDERGFCIELQDASAVIRLTLLRRDPEGEVRLRTLDTTVGLRN